MFEPINRLELSLAKAAADPAHRSQFYRDFLEAEVVVLGEGPPPHGDGLIAAGDKVEIRTIERHGKTVIPIFSSLPRLQAFTHERVSYLTMGTRVFLSMTKGAEVVLNPGSECGKEFDPPEIASLLDGSMWRPDSRVIVQKATKFLIGHPKRYPHELVDALRRSFAAIPEVRRAYVAHYFDGLRDSKPHTMVAIELDGDWDHVMESAGVIARSVFVPDPPVDFVRMTGARGVED